MISSASLRNLALAGLLLAAGCVPVLAGAGVRDRAAAGSHKQALGQFTADAYIEHVKVLASDEFEGRGTGEPGNDKAAAYIAEHFEAYGLKPAGVDNSYFQPFDARRGKKLSADEAAFEIVGRTGEWKLRSDWSPLPFSAVGDFEGPVAFAGYGIAAPDEQYDDYGDFDVRDKVLLIFRYEPRSADEDAALGGASPSRHALFATKAQEAARRGAKALLIVNPPGRDEKDALYRFGRDGSRETYEIPMVHIKREIAAELLRSSGLPELAELETALARDRKPLTRDLADVRVKVRTGLASNDLKTRNVLALLEGDGAADEYIVIGAHFDHLGLAPRMFSSDERRFIHNGADDNASGTSGLLELARVLSAAPRLRRSVLFIAFSGEEMGLLGSRHFVDHPTVPLPAIKAMLNFDMIGRFADDEVMIYGVPTAEEFPALLERVSAETELPFKPGKSLPGNSDHASFQARKIPVIFPFTGLHRQYHKPEDDWELIKPDGATRILRFSYLVLVELANMKDGPTWSDLRSRRPTDTAAAESRPGETGDGDGDAAADAAAAAAQPRPGERKPADPHAAAADSDAAAPPMPKVRMGVVPDYGFTGVGLKLTDVSAGGAAAAAGLKGGDILVKIGDSDVRGIETYMLALGRFKPGDSVEIIYLRDEQRQTATVKLTAPPGARERE